MTDFISFATLRPTNGAAKLAFSEVVEGFGANEDSRARLRVQLAPEPVFDRDVQYLQLQQKPTNESGADCDTGSPTDLDTENEQHMRYKGVVWSGVYHFSFTQLPRDAAAFGWVAGKAAFAEEHADLILATRKFAKLHDNKLRASHVRFNFSRNRAAFFVAKASRYASAELSVNGSNIRTGEVHFLNQRRMRLRISALKYEFEYAPFAYTTEYQSELMTAYLPECLHVDAASITVRIPTAEGEPRMFGEWTLSDPLGMGAQGKVSFASNRHGDVVAIKVVTRDYRRSASVNTEIDTLKALTRLSDTCGESRLLRLKGEIFS